jgi:hypothetical protein
MGLPDEIRCEASVLFHDVRVDDVDAERHADFVIARVLDHGTMASVRALYRHYGAGRLRRFFEAGGGDRVSPRTRALWIDHFGLDEAQCTKRSSRRISSPFWKP